MSEHETAVNADPYLWLEGIDDPRALEWVAVENARTMQRLEAQPQFASLRRQLLDILDSKERIPAIMVLGPWYYNFWRDQAHERGVLRRTTPEEFRKQEPAWEVVLDLDALATDEGENWVWSGMTALYPHYHRILISLSRGGGDTVVIREYDLNRRAFVESGFSVPAAKTRVEWIDADTIYVATNFGPGSLTRSGYPRIVKKWKRGQSLADATVVFEAKDTDVMVGVGCIRTWVDDTLVWTHFIQRRITFFEGEHFVLRGATWVRLDLPADADVGLYQDQILITLRSDWSVGHGSSAAAWRRGSVLATSLTAFLGGQREFAQLYEPGERKSLAGMTGTRRCLLVHEVEDMRNRVREWWRGDGAWRARETALPSDGTLSVSAADADRSDDYFLVHADAFTPTGLWLCRAGGDERESLKRLPAFFDADGMKVGSYEAVSKDGTRVPYCVLMPKGFQPSGDSPTLLYAYGGFQVPMLPLGYGAARGAGWLSRGGVFVVAGIRGGGEFGPSWHQAALKSKRQASYDDLIAVAEDLIARGITSSGHLGIQGGSNGGLMVGAVMVQRPNLFAAVVCQVPLLDMKRFHLLLAGASWMAEFGNPDDPAEWEFISRYSPYHNVHAGRRYPRILFTTSTRDDRVHPGHARKMMARMKEQGHDVWYFENTEGGHGLAANNPQMAKIMALEFTFLWDALR